MFRNNILRCIKRYFISRNMVEPKIKEFSFELCRKYLGGEWKKTPLAKFEIQRVHGGLTNHLFVCSLPNDTREKNPKSISKVLLRLYGAFYSDMSDSTVRMMEECMICVLLAEKKMGPDLYGIFPEGRLEQFIPDVRSLTSTEVRQPQLSRQIAEHVAAFHKLTLPLSKEGTWFLESLEKFIKEIKELKFSDSAKSRKLKEILALYDIDEGLQFIRSVVQNCDSPVLFCHNDMQPGNLLVKTYECLEVAKIKVIDFEYSCYNNRGFDIGNHFCEWVSDYNYPHYPYFIGDMTKYPSHDQKVFFVRTYLQALHEGENVSDEEVEKVIVEADRLSLLSHFFWGMFSILQSYKSTIDFGYLEYALYRLECFEHFKYLADDERSEGKKTLCINGSH
ncbi:choline kinase alpha-like [Dendronephthya gigantea]|uniref:choline kinase alpha-like n=1 Tax=Dendronephthya gigantea TaxID=151771 RepID=UPI00106A4847|nr:choline kinase alpha-like [Dendronephthya gigantea]